MRQKSQKRAALEHVDLIIELQSRSLRQIAAKFNTTTCIIQTVLTQQLQFKINNRQVEEIKKAQLTDEDFLLQSKGIGEWMLSAERGAIKDYKRNVLK